MSALNKATISRLLTVGCVLLEKAEARISFYSPWSGIFSTVTELVGRLLKLKIALDLKAGEDLEFICPLVTVPRPNRYLTWCISGVVYRLQESTFEKIADAISRAWWYLSKKQAVKMMEEGRE